MAIVQADQATSFQAMEPRLQQMIKIVQADPGVANVVGFTGGGGGTSTNTARMFISLKPLSERKVTADQVISAPAPQAGQHSRRHALPPAVAGPAHRRPREQRAVPVHAPGRQLSPRSRPGRRSCSTALQKDPVLTDVNSDQQNKGMQAMLTYDRDTAARFGITSQLLDNTLYDAFGQRPVSVMYTALNQYQVIMEAAPQYWENPGRPARHLRHIRPRATRCR